MNSLELTKKLANRKPTNTHYSDVAELIKGEFPQMDEMYNIDGNFNHHQFIADFDGIDVLDFIIKAKFIGTAKGYYHISSSEIKNI